MQYYDFILLCVGSSLVLGGVLGTVTTIPLELSMPLFGVVGMVLVAHALFVRGPVESVDELSAEVEPAEVPGLSRLEGQKQQE